MMANRTHVTLFVVAMTAATTSAFAEPITGQVFDRTFGVPLQGVTVNAIDTAGTSVIVTTDDNGAYAFDLAPGRYRITFLQGKQRVTGLVTLATGGVARLNGRLNVAIDETIVLDDVRKPKVLPEPIRTNTNTKTPPYSDRAILEDAWTRAWLLLDVDATGTVTQLKFLKRPGHDLESIAIAEGFALTFTPARNDRNEAVSAMVLWPIEWPAQSWLHYLQGQPTRMPEFGKAAAVPCQGSGPWRMKSIYKGYRDCSRPDLTKAGSEPWILPSGD
jgi:Carboxypeptidase regulatory-like domain